MMDFETANRVVTSIRIRDDALDVVKEIAELHDTSTSKVVEQLVLTYAVPYLEEVKSSGLDTPDRL